RCCGHPSPHDGNRSASLLSPLLGERLRAKAGDCVPRSSRPNRRPPKGDRRATLVSRDAGLVYVAAFLRSSAVGLIGVVLAIALTEAGVSVAGTGAVIGAGLAGIAAMTLVVTIAADRLGRPGTLYCVSVLPRFGSLLSP